MFFARDKTAQYSKVEVTRPWIKAENNVTGQAARLNFTCKNQPNRRLACLPLPREGGVDGMAFRIGDGIPPLRLTSAASAAPFVPKGVINLSAKQNSRGHR